MGDPWRERDETLGVQQPNFDKNDFFTSDMAGGEVEQLLTGVEEGTPKIPQGGRGVGAISHQRASLGGH
jgi:hypothetical protein